MPVDYNKSTVQEPYRPVYNEFTLKQLVAQYKRAPGAFRTDLIDQLEKDSQYYGVEFFRDPEDEEFRLLDTVKHLGTGFMSGFTTFKIGEEPKNAPERIADSIGHLAGFVGFVPTKAIGLVTRSARLVSAAESIRGRSVPMEIANRATKKATELIKPIFDKSVTGRGGAFETAIKWLQEPSRAHVVHDAFHLGVGMSVSSWQGGVDEMMRGFVGGAQTGAAFRLIGNLIKFPGVEPPKPFATFFKEQGKPQLTPAQQGERAARTIASSLYTGLPATMAGATTPEQIYEYLLGAYFGVKMTPTEITNRDRHIRNMFVDRKNKMLVPEITEGWEGLSPKEQKLVKESVREIVGPEGAGGQISIGALRKLGLEQMLMAPEYETTDKEATPKREMPKSKNSIQDDIISTIVKGEQPLPEVWKKLSYEDKVFYGEAMDASNMRGYFTFDQINRMNTEQIQAIAERLEIPKRKNMDDVQLAAEIIFRQPKIREEDALHLQADGEEIIAESLDTGEYRILPQNLVTWVERNMEWVGKDKVGAEKSNLISNEVDAIREYISEAYSRLTTKDGKERYQERDLDPLAVIDYIEAKHGRVVPPRGVEQMIQYITKKNQSMQMPFVTSKVSVDKEDPFNQYPYLTLMSQKGMPMNAAGITKQVDVVETQLDKVWKSLNPGTTESAYYAVDHWVIPGKRFLETIDLYRYKDSLETRFPNKGGQIFDGLMWNVMSSLSKRQLRDPNVREVKEAKDLYYFGGVSDKERAVFMHHHPETASLRTSQEKTILNKQFNDLISVFGREYFKDGGLYDAAEAAFITKYSGQKFNKKAPKHDKKILEMREYFKRSFLSNYYWDLATNGFQVPDYRTGNLNFAQRKELLEKNQGAGFLSNSKAFNKRAQIWFTSGFTANGERLNTYLDADGKMVNNELRFILTKDAEGKGLTDLSKAKEYIEATDGAILARDDFIYAISKESGMPEADIQGQSKSFIVSPSPEHGALLGKYMFHSAGKTLTEAMKKANIHFIIPESAAKQIGTREFGDFSVSPQGRLSIAKGTKVYTMKPEELHTVYSEIQDAHMIQPQRVYKQMFTNLTTHLAKNKLDNEVVRDMTESLIEESYNSSPYGTKLLERYHEMSSKGKVNKELQEEFLNNLEQISVPEIEKILQKKGHENFADRIYEKIVGINKTILAEAKRDGEIAEHDYEAFLAEAREFRSGTERVLGLGEQINKTTGEPVIGVFLHKFNRPFVQTIMKNWEVHRATRPLVLNSLSGRMRPYDKRLQRTLPELQDNQFYLDNNFRKMRIYSEEVGVRPDKNGRNYIDLETLWKQYTVEKRWERVPEVQQHVKEIFSALSARVPIDSMSGVRKLEFAGFTNRKGYGILLHPRVMRALGGADLDGDKATIYFGGRKADGSGYGFKESWKDLYKSQQDEFTRYRHKKTGEIKTELTESEIKSKQFQPYTTDNKNEPFQHGPLKGTGVTPRMLMTTDPNKLPPPYNNPKFREGLMNTNKEGLYYYLPIAREWMAEAASRGRQLLGTSASFKNNIQGAHSMLASMPNGEKQGYAVVPVYFKPSGAPKREAAQEYLVGVRFKETAKTDNESTSLYRDLSRTSIALPSDPMDEIGMKRRDKFFELLYDSIIDIKPSSIEIIDPKMTALTPFKVGDIIRPDKVGTRPEQANHRLLLENVLGEPQKSFDIMAFEAVNKKLNRIKQQGILKLFTDANSAYYGKNWSESRKHSMAETRRLAAGLAESDPNLANTHLPKIARLLARNNYYDSIISRINFEKMKEVYADHRKALEEYEVLRNALNRSTMSVSWKSNPYLEKVLQNELWLPDKQNEVIASASKFKEMFKGTPVEKRQYFMPTTGERVPYDYAIEHARRARDGRDAIDVRRQEIDRILEATNDMVIQDLWDMVSARQMKNAIESGNISPERAAEIFRMADVVRGYGEVIRKDDQSRNRQPDADDVFGGEKMPSAMTQAKIDADIFNVKRELDVGVTDANKKYETKLFDSFLTGSLHRGELGKLEAEYKARLDAGLVDEAYQTYYDSAKLGTANTSMSTFATKSRRIEDSTIRDYLQDFNQMFNRSADIVSEKERSRVNNEIENAEKPQKIEGIEVNVLEDPFQGIRRLQESAANKKLNKEGQEILTELEGHLEYYHNSIGVNLQEVVGGILAETAGGAKDLDAMTYRDWKIVNNFFREIRTGDWADRKTVPGVLIPQARYFRLFPEAINRSMMIHDFQLAKEKGLYLTSEGLYREGVIAKPTHMAQKSLDIMNHVVEQTVSFSDRERIRFRKELDPYIENTPEGMAIFEIAVSQREKGVAQWLKSILHEASPDNKGEILANIQTYMERANTTAKKHNWKELQDKVFEFDAVGPDGQSVRKKLTGRQYVKEINDILTKQMEHMHQWLNGTPEFKDMFLLKNEKGEQLYYNTLGEVTTGAMVGREVVDLQRFIKYANNKLKAGEDIPMEIGLTNMKRLIRQLQYDQATTAEHKRYIANQSIREVAEIPFESYFPHMLFDKKAGIENMKRMMENLYANKEKMTQKEFHQRAQKILWQHKQMTGEWELEEAKEWQLYDEVQAHLKDISGTLNPDHVASYTRAASVGPANQRLNHMPGWSYEPRVIDKYIRSVAGAFNRSVGQVVARNELHNWLNSKRDQFGEELSNSWERFFNIYINNSAGYPAVLPKEYVNDPHLKVKGTMYHWWAENNVRNKINNIMDKLGMMKKDLPKEMQGVSIQNIRDIANLEAKYTMSALLFHPKNLMGNLYGGTALTAQSVGFNTLKEARNINWLKSHLNPGKDALGNEWNSVQDVNKWVESLGVVPEMITHEAGINPNTAKANVRKAIDEAVRVIRRDPEVSDKTLLGIAREYGITDRFWDTSAYFMKKGERVLRRDSFMAHLIQAWKGYNGALPFDHPILIAHAKKGVKATQFLYNAPNRPMFAQTSLGKIVSRFQLWSWNSVRFRNDVNRMAQRYGYQEGSPAYERMRRTMQMDLFMLGLSSVFMYSLFESALPAPWNWFQDTADWLMGDEKERDRAFFGAWPTDLAPLQMVTPVALRPLPNIFRGLMDEDWSKLSDYTVWTMFPMGRMARDLAGPNNLLENPIRAVEKLTGLPYLQFHRQLKENRDEEMTYPKGIMGW
tara:strand:+ start:39 stop:9392 length:9354 start_codon:yes stop_codon:yes gene_type:complete